MQLRLFSRWRGAVDRYLDQLDDGMTLRPHAVYARSKLATGLLMREYGRQRIGLTEQ